MQIQALIARHPRLAGLITSYAQALVDQIETELAQAQQLSDLAPDEALEQAQAQETAAAAAATHRDMAALRLQGFLEGVISASTPAA